MTVRGREGTYPEGATVAGCPVMDEAHADDGAIHSFWDFIAFVRTLPDPPDYAGRLDNPGRLREAVEDYEDIS